MIDHQYLQLLTLRSHETSQVIGNATAVAKAAKIFAVPTLLTTAFAERQNLIWRRLRPRAALGMAAPRPQGRHALTPQMTAASMESPRPTQLGDMPWLA
jgi:hypothetical protein